MHKTMDVITYPSPNLHVYLLIRVITAIIFVKYLYNEVIKLTA